MTIGRILLGITATFASIAAMAGLSWATPTIDRWLENFDRIVFEAEFGQELPAVIRKWDQPLRVRIDTPNGSAALYRDAVADHLTLLAGLTGLRMAIAEDLAPANVVMVFAREDALIEAVNRHLDRPILSAERLNGSLCFGLFLAEEPTGRIVEAVIGIPTDRAGALGKIDACIVEELTQILGLPNDDSAVQPSIFNDSSAEEELTEQDRWMVRTLYRADIPPGMARVEALTVLRRLAAAGLL